MLVDTISLTNGEMVCIDLDGVTRNIHEFVRVSPTIVIGVHNEERFPVIFVWFKQGDVYLYATQLEFKVGLDEIFYRVPPRDWTIPPKR